MNRFKSIAVIGTGAIGGYYGGLLQRSGQNVHFLLHSDYEHVREHGLRIDSKNGDFTLPQVNAWRTAADMPMCDLVLVALKTTANQILPEILPHVVHEHSTVLVLQNGLGSDDDVASVIGAERVIGGLCFICSGKVGPGHIHHQDFGMITLGEYRADGSAAGLTPRLKALGALLESAGIPIRMEEDLLLARWKKLVWNIPFNGLSVVKNCLTDTLMSDPETRALCRRLMEEVAAGSVACARPVETAFIDQMLDYTGSMTPYAPSMKLDYDHGRPLELEAIYGNPLRAARAAGVEMPETQKLYDQLRELSA
ncbi:putative 2-dehydropantoate 2-reductase [Tichowtungia aerotolerans]|uniref:2-dehydropantoate 2-reductase n=1 Tax=Tichowtungia aerotolerans TaxID=2697043 RepID=A0A6P1MEG9_9BACT|nr:putative 2-dehydropantoate 2-reductase [Tichowtungia aerotolerans]QHI70006.1 putative 2-dehydropantoate 2-reductase [Tichowtungia aerotolerans]